MAAGRKLTCGNSGVMGRGPVSAGACCFALMVLSLVVGCSKVENDPKAVVHSFIEALHTRDQGLLDRQMAWDEVALNQYYVSRDYYESLTEQQRGEVVATYRDIFFKEYFPVAATVTYVAEEVYTARGTGNAIISATFPRNQAGDGKQEEKQQFNLELSLFKDRNRWYIVDLNDFIQLNMLRGEYDPGKFYLPEPIH